jgi:16S rRNA (guanine527-N7)-methyltransferase
VAVSLEEPTGDDEWPTGLLALKGGNLSDEVAALRDADSGAELEQTSLEALLGRNGFFEEKEIVAVRSR